MKTVHCAVRPNKRLITASARFGIVVRRSDAGRTDPIGVARDIDDRLSPGQIALVTGPSGSGKTTLVRTLTRLIRARGGRVVTPDRSRLLNTRRPVIDLIPGDIDDATRLLARAGLGEAPLFARLPSELSAGQHARLALAMALARADGATVVCDEFASLLDRVTAQCLASSLARWVRRENTTRLVCATAHEDLADAFAPNLRIRVDTNGVTEIRHG